MKKLLLFFFAVPLLLGAVKHKEFCCDPAPEQGPPGLPGPSGPPGPTGPAGPQGLPGSAVTDFLYAYNTSTFVVTPGSDIPVTSIHAIDPTTTMSVSGGKVHIDDEGFYLVFFGIHTTAPLPSDASIVLLVDDVDGGIPFHAVSSGTVILELFGPSTHTLSLKLLTGTSPPPITIGSPAKTSLPSAYIEPIQLISFSVGNSDSK